MFAIAGGGLPGQFAGVFTGLGVVLYDANNGPVRVSFLEQRPDADRICTDADQVLE